MIKNFDDFLINLLMFYSMCKSYCRIDESLQGVVDYKVAKYFHTIPKSHDVCMTFNVELKKWSILDAHILCKI